MSATKNGISYHYLVNKKEVYEHMLNNGVKDVSLVEKEMPEEFDYLDIGEETGIIMILFQNDQSSFLRSRYLEEEGIIVFSNQSIPDEAAGVLTGIGHDADDGRSVITDMNEFLIFVDWVVDNTDQILKERLAGEYADRCGNCHSVLEEDALYCPYCGTKRGEGEFLPFRNVAVVVYGPPVNRHFKCGSCGLIWNTCVLGGDDSKFCPRCGKRVSILQEKILSYFDFSDASIPGVEDIKKGAGEMKKNITDFGKDAVNAAVNLGTTAKETVKKSANKVEDTAKSVIDSAKNWYRVFSKEDPSGLGEESELIIDRFNEMEIETILMQSKVARVIYVHCPKEEIEKLIRELGRDRYGYGSVNKTQLFQIMNMSSKLTAKEKVIDTDEKEKNKKLDEQ